MKAIRNTLFFIVLVLGTMPVIMLPMSKVDPTQKDDCKSESRKHEGYGYNYSYWVALKYYLESFFYDQDYHKIWKGVIGSNKVNVMLTRSESYCKRYDIDRPQALALWAHDKHIFEKLLPYLKTYDEVFVVIGYSDAACVIHDADFYHAGIFIGKEWPTFTTQEKEFVIAHEIAHILLGHGHRHGHKIEKDFKSQADFCGYKKQCERDADLYAAKLLGTAHGGISLFTKRDAHTRKMCVHCGFHANEVDQMMNTVISSKAKTAAQYIAVLKRFHDDRVKKNNWSYLKRVYEQYKLIRISGSVINTTHPQDIERVAYLKKWEQNHA